MFNNVKVYLSITIILHHSILVSCILKDVKPNVEADIAEITALTRQWANNLSWKLTTLSELTRRKKVQKSFKKYNIEEEKWDSIVEEVAENIRLMMKEKEKAVDAIKHHAEVLSLHRKDDIDTASSYDYYNANNLTKTDSVNDRIHDIEEAERIWKCSIPQHVKNLCFDNSYQKNELFSRIVNIPGKSYYRKISDLYTQLGRCEKIAFLYRPKDYYREMNMEYHPQFDIPVNLNYSIVRVTPSVYDRALNVLNEIRWTEALDLTFKCNFKRDPTLTYQYFASPQGFLRFYPAMEWSEEQYNNTFDFRLRSWYIEAMSSAKDIIILLDRSGSMKGYRRLLATEIVNSILDTLTDNDYVNIYTFTNTTEPLVDCFNDTLVQANEENLRLLREQLESIKDIFYSDISLGLEKAFPILWKYRQARNSTDREPLQCNQAIMIITEGLDYEYRDVLFKIYNHIPDEEYYRPIRVFTYLIGTEPTDAKRMKWIACANMGYYVNITVIEEVREKVLKYLEVMSRPINMSPKIKPEPAWTALYAHLADRRLSNFLWKRNEGNRQRDIFIEYEKQYMAKHGLTVLENTTHFTQETEHDYQQYREFAEYKFLTSVSLPVFDYRPNATSLLGVAAVDVPLDFIKQLAEPHRIGVNGYSFTITNNGYVLHHPDHRTEFRNHILKPTFNRVDVTEVEISNDTIEPRKFDAGIIGLRQNIVLQHKGSKSLNVRTPIDDMKRVMLGRRHYFYTKIGPFSLVIALPDNYGFLVSRHKISVAELENIKENLKESLHRYKNWRVHPKWLYTCNTTRAEKSPENELLRFLHTNISNCKEHDVVNALLKDVNVTEWFNNRHEIEDLKTEYKDKSKTYRKSNLLDGVVLLFMATHTGLTRWVNLINVKEDQKHFANKHNKASDEIYYRRAADMNSRNGSYDRFMYSVPFEPYEDNKTLITASHVIFHQKNNRRAPIAAVGYQIYHRTLNKILQTFKCEQSRPHCKISCFGPHAWKCYVVDNDGYIILANKTKLVSKSLADVDIALMKTLVKDDVFKEITVFDYQGTCYPDYAYKSKEKFYGPTDEEVKDKKINCVKPTIKCKTIEYLRLRVKKTIPTPCDIEFKMYNYQFKAFSHLHPTQNDRDCPCPYITEPIEGTNLLLIALDKKCCDKESGVPINEYPKEISYDLTLPCHIAVNNNFTKRHYTKCITKNPREFTLNTNNTYCGGEDIVPLE